MSTYSIRRGPFVLEIGSSSTLPTEDDIIQDSGGSYPELRAQINPFSPKLHFSGCFNTVTRNRIRIFQPGKGENGDAASHKEQAPRVTAKQVGVRQSWVKKR